MVTQNKFRSPELNTAPRNDSEVQRDQTHRGQANAVPDGDRSLPLITLPPRLPKQSQRRTQSNIPNDRARRDRLREVAAKVVAEENAVPPLTMDELTALTATVRERVGIDGTYDDFLAVIISNEAWRESVARVPYDRRLLLVPKCLRVEEVCPAPFDEFGLLCKECGLCSLHDLTVEAERLGYAVLVAEGSAIVRSMIETGKIEAIVGVSCLNVLEKCFPHLEAAAVPGVAIPLLQDDCVNTSVDLDWVWDLLHLTSDDKTYRLDLDALRDTVDGWFTPDSLATIMGTSRGRTEEMAQDWVAQAGKRWRPYLTACVYMAFSSHSNEAPPPIPSDLKKLAVAVECFHKASLIHDDIEDNDDLRYGQKTLHALHGVPVALNVGDFLLGEGYRLIGELDVPAEQTAEMLRIAAAGHLTLSRGQGAELCWANDPQPLSSLEVLDIFRQKTAPAFEVALRLGAVYAGADEEVHTALSEYSEALGIAYQIRDDLEDFTGESDSNDLADLRPSLLLAIAQKRAKGEPAKQLISSLWRREIPYAGVADDVMKVFEEGSVVEKATELLAAYRDQATRSLRYVPNATLKGLLRRVVGKIFPQALIEGYCSEFEARNAASGASGAEHAA
ncbi:MAG: polyprenyl synthetase family protein [Planctomycetes bacterium]|nr:polyprenyl synthetase family protein [Planctomycetota bacterium]